MTHHESSPSIKALRHEAEAPSVARSLNAVIVGRLDLADDSAIFRVAPIEWELPPFEPGQFATLGLPNEGPALQASDEPIPHAQPHPQDATPHGQVQGRLIRRAYSIASPPSNREYLELYIIHVPHGRFTSRLWPCRTGDRVWLDPRIRGRFTLEHVPPTADLLMVATGTGIAPYMSMLREHQGRGRWRRAALIHGVRFAADLAYRDELEQWANDDPGFAYLPTVTREAADSTWRGLRGRIQAVLGDSALLMRLTGIDLNPERCHVLLCGNPAMIQDATAMLQSQGFRSGTQKDPGNIHFERYW